MLNAQLLICLQATHILLFHSAQCHNRYQELLFSVPMQLKKVRVGGSLLTKIQESLIFIYHFPDSS